MRLIINTASTFKGGGVQVARSFLYECRAFDEHEFGVVLGPGLEAVVDTSDFPTNFQFFRLGYRPAERVFSAGGAASDLQHIEAAFDANVVFTTSGPSYWRPRAKHLMGFNLPHYMYPESPFFSHLLGPLERLRWYAKSKLIHHFTRGFADAWVVQTDDVNQRLRRWIKSESVYTVPNTISSAYLASASEPPPEEESQVKALRHDFRVLVLSSYYRHKNLEILNDIINVMRERSIDDVRFVMTLPSQDFEKTISPQNRKFVNNVGPQRPEKCPALYHSADALFLPTLLECFSANYVEAMAMGRPIVTTDLGFAHSICADAALYFEPLNALHALERILELKASSHLSKYLVALGKQELKRFGTARERAQAYLSLCIEMTKHKIPESEAR